MRIAFILCYCYWIPTGIWAQDSLRAPIEFSQNSLPSRTYSPNDEQLGVASERLGQAYLDKGELGKAEQNYKIAYQYYQKSGKKEAAIRVLRSIAQLQETQGKTNDATLNFKQAAYLGLDLPQSNTSNSLNTNDVQRLRNNYKPDAQKAYILDNIGIAKETGNTQELANAYRQLGDINLTQGKNEEAAENYQNALSQTATPAQSVQLGQQIASAYLSKGEFENAVAVQEQVLQQEGLKDNPALKIQQIQQIASLYQQNQQQPEALTLLKKSFDLAMQEHRTLDAKNSLEKMAAIYSSMGDQQTGVELQRRFLGQLDSLLLTDPSIVDARLLAATEEKISRLEQEKTLQTELIRRQNQFNYFLMAAAALLLVLVFFIARALMAIQTKNKKIALQSLRREMNPHFVFNSLNSINHFIAQNRELEANKFLSSYSQLMRASMEHSNKDFVPLSTELDMLGKYLELEQMRFPDKLSYQIIVSEDIDPDAVQIPNMLLQPLLENAIWHGLRYKTEKGSLVLTIKQLNEKITANVEDDGIGLAQSQALKTMHQKAHRPIGLSNTRERIMLLNQIYGTKISLELIEKTAPDTGTIAQLNF